MPRQELTLFDDDGMHGQNLACVRKSEPVTSREVLHSSRSVEWYTPARYMEAVRLVLGSIDLDPASCALANETVKAKRYYDLESDGLAHDWPGKVFLNPPYGKTGAGQSRQQVWSERLLQQYQAGITQEAVLLVNAATGDLWFQRLWKALPMGSPVCFTRRIRFYTSESHSQQPTHGNFFVYFGPAPRRFFEVFEPLGVIVARIA